MTGSDDTTHTTGTARAACASRTKTSRRSTRCSAASRTGSSIELLDLVDQFGGVDAINRAADEAGDLENRLARLEAEGSP